MYLQIIKDYRISDNSCERSHSYKNFGMVLCEITKNNKKYNDHNPFDGDPCDVSISQFDDSICPRGNPIHIAKKSNNKKRPAKCK